MPDFVLIDNLDTLLADELSAALASAHALDVAASYFSINGYEHIVSGVEELLDRGGVVRFLLGVHPSPSARALLSVLRAAQSHHGSEKVAVRFIPPTDDRDFHAKVYIAKQGETSTLVVGSSNLSQQGLVNNLELNYREVVSTDSNKCQAVCEWFNRLFNEEAVEYRWETIEELFTLPPFEGMPKPPSSETAFLYTEHFIALQLNHLRVPLGGRITPFFYQIEDVKTIADEFEERLGGRRGKLIAHEVGLGKTIVAGLAIKELLMRERIDRVLILCPASVTEQWQQEMLDKIDEEFVIINPDRFHALGQKVWEETPRAICSLDFLKTHMLERNPDKRRRRYTPYILKDAWPKDLKYDFIVFDESHYAKSNTAMRYKAVWQLVQQLRAQDGFILLMTATPVMNREEELYYQLALTYPDMLTQPDGTRENPKKSDLNALGEQWVALRRESIRRKLRRDSDIKPLFAERKAPEDLTFEMTPAESELYSEFARYISDESEYYKLISIRAQALGSPFLRIVPFIKTTYLREFCSSSDAIYNALVGKDVEENSVWQLEENWNSTRDLASSVGGEDADARHMGLKGKILRALRNGYILFGKADAEDLERIQAVSPELFEQIEEVDEETFRINLSEQQSSGLLDEVRRIDGFASRIKAVAPFAKEKEFVRKIQDILRQGGQRGPRKAIVFLAYIPTGERLERLLRDAGVRTAFYRGGLDEHQRKRLIDRLWARVEEKHREDPDRGEIDVLLATDAGGVGLNLQVANHVTNYDLSWNPMVVEQRVGRVHRLGQRRKHVFVENFFAKTHGDAEDRVLSIEENLHSALGDKVALIRGLGIDLSDEVIGDELLSDTELADAELRYRTRTITEDQYKRVVDRVVKRKAEDLKKLSDLKALVSVTDEAERARAVQQSHIFDRYTTEVFDILRTRYADHITEHHDGSVTVMPSTKLAVDNGLAGTESRRLTLDRDTAEHSGDRIDLFSVRHPWLRAITRKTLETSAPLIEAKDIQLDDLRDIGLDSDRVIQMDALREDIGECDVAHQLNFFITHKLRRGDEELAPVRRLFSVLIFDDGRDSTDAVLGAKLNLAPATPKPHPAVIPQGTLARGRELATEELDRIVSEVNQANETDLAIRHTFQAGKQASDEGSIMEELRDLRDRVLPKLRQGQPIAGFATVAEAEAHETELRAGLSTLYDQGTLLTQQQQDAFERARQVQVEKFEPELVSYCRYNFLRGN